MKKGEDEIEAIINGYRTSYDTGSDFNPFFRYFIKNNVKICIFFSLLAKSVFHPIAFLRSLHKEENGN